MSRGLGARQLEMVGRMEEGAEVWFRRGTRANFYLSDDTERSVSPDVVWSLIARGIIAPRKVDGEGVVHVMALAPDYVEKVGPGSAGDRLLDALLTDGGWLTTTALETRLPDLDAMTVRRALDRLKKKGYVEARQHAMNGSGHHENEWRVHDDYEQVR